MIKIPEMRENTVIFSERKMPIMLAEAPKQIKTNEKPKMKDKDVIRILFVTSSEPDTPSSYSFKELPDKKDINPGIIGRTHGDRKDKIPATKAITKETFSI